MYKTPSSSILARATSPGFRLPALAIFPGLTLPPTALLPDLRPSPGSLPPADLGGTDVTLLAPRTGLGILGFVAVADPSGAFGAGYLADRGLLAPIGLVSIESFDEGALNGLAISPPSVCLGLELVVTAPAAPPKVKLVDIGPGFLGVSWTGLGGACFPFREGVDWGRLYRNGAVDLVCKMCTVSWWVSLVLDIVFFGNFGKFCVAPYF